jgi:hypothetical protein
VKAGPGSTKNIALDKNRQDKLTAIFRLTEPGIDIVAQGGWALQP